MHPIGDWTKKWIVCPHTLLKITLCNKGPFDHYRLDAITPSLLDLRDEDAMTPSLFLWFSGPSLMRCPSIGFIYKKSPLIGERHIKVKVASKNRGYFALMLIQLLPPFDYVVSTCADCHKCWWWTCGNWLLMVHRLARQCFLCWLVDELSLVCEFRVKPPLFCMGTQWLLKLVKMVL